jgi:hypothetical protein
MKLLINFACFQLGWFACVLGAANGIPWAGPMIVTLVVAIHLLIAQRPGLELWLVAAAMAVGLVADSLLLASGWISYPNGYWVPGLAPYWIIAMWALFATTLNVSMRWLRGSLPLTVLMGAVGGPLSYLAGAKLGGIEFLAPIWAMSALAVIWALVMPFLTLLSCRLDGMTEVAIPDFVQSDWRVSTHG